MRARKTACRKTLVKWITRSPVNGKNGLASISGPVNQSISTSCVMLLLFYKRKQRWRMYIWRSIGKLNILRHSERELILKKEQQIAVENLLLGSDVERKWSSFCVSLLLFRSNSVHFFDFGLRLEQQTVVGYCLLIRLALSYSPYNFRLFHDKPLRLLVQSWYSQKVHEHSALRAHKPCEPDQTYRFEVVDVLNIISDDIYIFLISLNLTLKEHLHNLQKSLGHSLAGFLPLLTFLVGVCICAIFYCYIK